MSKNKNLPLIITAGILIVCAVFCAVIYLLPKPEPTPTTVAVVSTEAPTDEASSVQGSTDTPAPPTSPPDPTAASEPDDTPTTEPPTPTPEPPTDTPTPAPTDTPAPPTDAPTPEPPTDTPTPILPPTPIALSGSGDSIVDVQKPAGPMLALISGNGDNSFFAVTSLDANNQPQDLLVNTVETYIGIRPIDFLDGQQTTRFEVKATGNWEIKLHPLDAAERLNVPGEFKGTGDNVITLAGGTPDLANISGNAAGSYFGVMGYGGSFPDMLVNDVEPYQGTVILSPDTIVLVIQATGDWSIAVTGK